MSPAAPAALAETTDSKHWNAELELEFRAQGGRTVALRKRHVGPLVTQQPHYPDGPRRCESILVHPPAGIAGGDRLHLSVTVGTAAEALLTTPGATRFYRERGSAAEVEQRFQVEPGGTLEWVPQETLVYDRCHARCKTRIDLAPGAKLLTWEIFGLGRPASKRPFRQGDCRIALEVWRDREPLWYDLTRFESNSDLASASWGLQNFSCVGTWLATGADEQTLSIARQLAAEADDSVFAAATRIDDLLVVRALSHHTRRVFLFFSSLRNELREPLLDSPATPPRIWST